MTVPFGRFGLRVFTYCGFVKAAIQPCRRLGGCRGQQLPAGEEQVHQSTDRKQAVGIFLQSSVAHLHTAKLQLHHAEHKLDPGCARVIWSGSSPVPPRRFHLYSGNALRTLEGHSSVVYGVAVTPDEQRAVSASDDQTLKVWGLESGRCLATFTCDSAAFC